MTRAVSCFVVFSLFFQVVMAAAAESEKEMAAIAAAEKWLALVDAGNYAESWKQGAQYFRNSISEDRWVATNEAVRKPLGKVLSRKLQASAYRTSLPGAPDGEYVVMQFDTSFEHKKQAVETMTLMMDKDGKWRASGYYFR